MAKRTNPSAQEQEPGFEQAVAELEELIERIESGQVGLEECLTQYERGMKLIARCKSVLGAAQKRIAELNINTDGSLRASGQTDDSMESADALDDEMEGELSDESDDR